MRIMLMIRMYTNNYYHLLILLIVFSLDLNKISRFLFNFGKLILKFLCLRFYIVCHLVCPIYHFNNLFLCCCLF